MPAAVNRAQGPTGRALDTAESVDEQRRGTGAALYQLLLDGPEPDERNRVLDAVRSNEHDEAEGEASGERPPRAIW
jgi:hypothetical protein